MDCAAENDIGGVIASQFFHALFAKHPFDGIDDIGFPGAVRTDDSRNSFVEL